MELPRNITQVGETDRNCKIYVEDYVVSYMKQMNKFAEEKEISVALYGKMSVEEQVTYCFVYGACVIQSVAREVRHLSQAQNQEIERLRRKYFPEQTFLGYQILNGEMIEGFRIYDQNSCRYVKGYACFFEKNDGMLAYMLENRREEVQPEKVEQDKYDMVRKRQEDRRLQFEDRGQSRKRQADEERAESSRGVRKAVKKEAVKETAAIEENRENYRFKVMPFVAVAGCCLLAMTVWGNDGVQESVKSQLTSWVTNLTELKLAENENAGKEDAAAGGIEQEEVQAVMGTLVTEDKLAEAIRQENEKMSETIASAEAGGENAEQASNADTSSSSAAGAGVLGESTSTDITGTSGTSTSVGATGTSGTSATTGANNGSGTTTPAGAADISGASTSSEATAPDASINSDVSETEDSGTPTAGDDAENTETQETATQPQTYVIRQGDTLIAISNNVYGNDTYVSEICALNNISNPDNIQIGQKILLP